MPTLTEEGRALIVRVADPDLRTQMFRWLASVQIMEECLDERVDEAMTHEQARADLLGQMRVPGNGH
jgi:hypothetical protein